MCASKTDVLKRIGSQQKTVTNLQGAMFPAFVEVVKNLFLKSAMSGRL